MMTSKFKKLLAITTLSSIAFAVGGTSDIVAPGDYSVTGSATVEALAGSGAPTLEFDNGRGGTQTWVYDGVLDLYRPIPATDPDLRGCFEGQGDGTYEYEITDAAGNDKGSGTITPI